MKIGTITIGQSPRDDVITEMREILGTEIEIIEKGALDSLSLKEVESLYPELHDTTLVTRMKDGTEVKVAEKHVIPRLKDCISELEEKQADLIILLCTGEFPELESRKILLQPAKILYNIVKAVLEKGKLGVVVPADEQIPAIEKKWKRKNIDIALEAISPYTANDEAVEKIAYKIKRSDTDLIVLDCIGYTVHIKSLLRGITEKPVLLPRTIIGRVARELIGI